MDIWKPYEVATKARCPHAAIVYDRFHVEQGFKRLIDAVRREEYPKVTGQEKNATKGLMYLLYTRPRNLRCKDRRPLDVAYIQLAHNVRDEKSGQVKANILYNFGRADQLDVAAIRRLVQSLSRFLSPEEMLQVQGKVNGALRFLWSRSMGGAWVLRRLWERLGLDQALSERGFFSPVEWAIFAMVANRASAPSSKLATEEWVRQDVVLGNDKLIKVQHLYRVMDFLLEHEEAIQREVFFDTTTSYFDLDEQDDEEGLRRYRLSKDKRVDLPQVVIGLAVTKEGNQYAAGCSRATLPIQPQ